jgi:hypothetical protein
VTVTANNQTMVAGASVPTLTYTLSPSVTLTTNPTCTTTAPIGLSDGAQTAYADLTAVARFNPSGDIDAYNGGSTAAYQAASTIPYTPGTTYLFEYDVDISAKTYSVYVTPSGGTKTVASPSSSRQRR